MYNIFIPLLLIFKWVHCLPTQCLTDSEGAAKNKPCAFPFVFKNKLFEKCTDFEDPDGKNWCSTKTDTNNNHVSGKGNWGYCREVCLETTTDQAEETKGQNCLTTEDSPLKGQPCAFPFVYKGQKYLECTSVEDPNNRSWCSIKTDENDNHVKGKNTWGYCQENCHLDEKTLTRKPDPPPLEEENYDNDDPTTLGTYLPSEEDGCGTSIDEGQIVGGEETKEGELPFMALLGYVNKRGGGNDIKFKCGGTLINRRYVLTAAHCQKVSDPIAQVVLGEHDLNEEQDCGKCDPVQKFDININDVTVHEDWIPEKVATNANDIALIRLPRLVTTYYEKTSARVVPICLGWGEDEEVPLDKQIAAGWGRTTNNYFDKGDVDKTGAFSSILLKVETPFIPIAECKRKHSVFNIITDEKQVCAGGLSGKDSCSGDSGGPLITYDGVDPYTSHKYLYGIVSFGTRKCGSGTPGVYTYLNYYKDWVLKNLKP